MERSDHNRKKLNYICKMEMTYTLAELGTVCQKLWQEHQNVKTWLFHAEMGAGKTTLICTLCKEVLQSEDNLSSPTFSLINLYDSPSIGQICHIDLYRIESDEEAINAGVEEAITSSNLSLIEWPEKTPNLYEGTVVEVEIGILPEGKRKITTHINTY